MLVAVVVGALNAAKLVLACRQRIIDQVLLHLELERRVEAVVTRVHEVAEVGGEEHLHDVTVAAHARELVGLPALLIISQQHVARFECLIAKSPLEPRDSATSPATNIRF